MNKGGRLFNGWLSDGKFTLGVILGKDSRDVYDIQWEDFSFVTKHRKDFLFPKYTLIKKEIS